MIGWPYSLYGLVLLVTTAVLLVALLVIWPRRHVPGGSSLVSLLGVLTLWTVTSALEVFAASIQAKGLFACFEYLGIASVAPLFFLFALEYTGADSYKDNHWLFLLWLVPLITVALAFTNDVHHLLWSRVYLGSASQLTYEYGPWFWVQTLYSYSLILSGLIVLVRSVIRSPRIYRHQVAVLLGAVAVPWVGNFIYLFGLGSLWGGDPTPMAFSFTGLVLSVSFFQLQLFELTPVALEAIFENMGDALLVVDTVGRIVQLNPAAQALLNVTADQAIGQPAAQFFSALGGLKAELWKSQEFQLECSSPGLLHHYLDIRVSPLLSRSQHLTGWLVTLRDITQRKQAEDLARQSEQKYRQVVETVQEGIWVVDQNALTTFVNPHMAEMLGYSVEDMLGRDLFSFMGERGKVLDLGERGGNLAEQNLEYHCQEESQNHDIELLRKDGTRIYVTLNAAPIIAPDGGHQGIIAGVMDITQRRQAEQAELEQRLLAEALRDTTAALTSTVNYDEVLDRILDYLGRMLPHDLASIGLVNDGGEVEIVRAREYADFDLEDFLLTLYLPVDKLPNWHLLVETGCPVVIPDTLADPDWMRLPTPSRLRSYAGAPLSIKGKVVGFINLYSLQPGFFSPLQGERLQTFANQAAVAIENSRLYAQVQRMAIVDELTGVYNFRGLQELGVREVERAHRFARPLAALFCDIDHFRDFNNRYSHAVGNLVLKDVAQHTRSSVRAVDLVARYGGEEFVILLPETELAEGVAVAERLRQEIAAHAVPTEHGTLSVTISIGVAALSSTTSDLDVLIDHANQAEHLAKTRGRNRVDVL